VFGRLMLAGALRFTIEFVRVNAPVMGLLTLAQLFSAAIMIVGLWFIRMPGETPRARATRQLACDTAHIRRVLMTTAVVVGGWCWLSRDRSRQPRRAGR
jgi:hypothetical protein